MNNQIAKWARIEQTPQQRTYVDGKQTYKKCLTSHIMREHEIPPQIKQWDTTMHLSEWSKSKTLTTLNADQDVEQPELPSTAGGNAIFRYFIRQFSSFLKH